MADNINEIIYKITLDVAQTNAALLAYIAQAKEATQANKDLQDSLTGTNTEADRQATAAKKTQDAIKAEEGSITALRNANKALTQERNATTVSTDAGRAKVAELNKQLNANNNIIKGNVDAYTKMKLGIGDYSGALDKLVPGLGATINGIVGMTEAGLAFIATPVGMVVAALGLALGALMVYFKGSQEGQDNLNRLMLVGSAVMQKVMDVVKLLGGAIFAAFDNPKKALSDLGEFVENNLINRFKAFGVILEGIINLDFKQVLNGTAQLGSGITNVIDKYQNFSKQVSEQVAKGIVDGNKLADLDEQITRRSISNSIERANADLNVSKLRSEAARKEGADKRALIEEAIALEQKQSDNDVALAQMRLQYAKEEMAAGNATIEAKKKIADAEVAVINATKERYDGIVRFEKQLEALQKQEEADAQKLADAKFKISQDAWAKEVKLRQEQNAIKEKEALDDFDRAKKTADAKLKVEQQLNEGGLELLKKSTKEGSAVRTAGNLLFKQDKIKEATSNMFTAASAAAASAAEIPVVGWILSPLAYAASILQVGAAVAGIAGLAFAGGGKAPLSGTRINETMGTPIVRSNGDNLLATVRRGEVILNERQQASLGGDATFRKIGVPGFASGGVTGSMETRLAVDSSNRRNSDDIVNAILNQPRVAVVVDDVNLAQSQRAQVKQSATF